jgi:hypothetical protein
VNAFSPNYVSQLTPVKKKPIAKKQANPFDTDDHKARQACVQCQRHTPIHAPI